MNLKAQTRFTWILLFLAIGLHVLMVGRALVIMQKLRGINATFADEHVKLVSLLNLTNSVRLAEEHIRECTFHPSHANIVLYCEDLRAADGSAAKAAAIDAVSGSFSMADIAALRAELKAHMACCAAPAGVSPDKRTAQEEFSRFYDTASAMRRKLSAHTRAKLDSSTLLADEAKAETLQLVLSSSVIATFILLLLGWVIYSLRNLNRAIAEQRDEILVLKSGIEESSLGMVLTDTSGNIEYVNPAFSLMHGYSREETIGKNPRLLKSGEMPDELYKSLWRTLLAGQAWNGELHNKTKAGTYIWVRANISPIRNAEGKLTHFMALHKDITLEKQLLADLVQAKGEAEQANHAKSDFLASMSHEIRTPLNAIVGMSELIDETALNREQAQYLSIMRGASDTLLSLINDVLDISKIEAGKTELEKAPFNLEELVSQVSDIISVRASKKNVEVSCKLEADVPVFVEGDATRLKQVLLNLMGNAVKFVDKGWVSLNVKKNRTEGECIQLQFSVKDTGIGIPADKQGSIFEKFTQADTSTTRKYGGTGLGLPIAKMLIELMGGRIWLESEPGVGTVFYFTVMLCPQKGRHDVYLPKADIKELKGLKFLVVDDNMVNRIITREIVQSWGAYCEGAQDAETGLEKIREEQLAGSPFHGIFVDFNMPGMDGYEFCRRLKADASVSPQPAVAVVTSDTVRFKKEDFRAIGVNTYLIKPVKKQTLLDCTLEMMAAGKPAAAAERTAAPEARKKDGCSKEDLPALNVLIVDDAPDNRVLMAALLKGSKVKLDLAEDGLQALEKFKSGVYDLIFMDMHMPGMDGYEATAKLRELEAAGKLARTRVVALTALATRDDADKALKAGCDDYLTKPIRRNTFYSYLVNFAAGRS